MTTTLSHSSPVPGIALKMKSVMEISEMAAAAIEALNLTCFLLLYVTDDYVDLVLSCVAVLLALIFFVVPAHVLTTFAPFRTILTLSITVLITFAITCMSVEGNLRAKRNDVV